MIAAHKVSRRRLLRNISLTVGSTAVAGAPSQAWASGGKAQFALRTAQDVRAVSFMSIGSLQEQEMYQQAIEAAQQETLNDLNIQINWQAAPSNEWERIMTLFAADQASDIQRIDDDRVYLLASENKIHQLDPWILDPEIGMDPTLYYPRTFTSLAIEGYQFGVIPASSANVVYYNRDHFDEAGLTAPTSWNDAWDLDVFIENVRTLAEVSGAYGVAFPSNVITPIMYGAGGSALTEDQTACAFDGTEVEQALDQFVRLVVDEEFANRPEEVPLEMFNSGLASMMWSAMNAGSEISQDINWGIMPWCKTPLHAMTENYDRAFVIPKSAQDPEAAFIALKALTGKAPSDIFAQSRWGVPNLIESAEGEAFNDPSLPPENKNVWAETFGAIGDQPVDVNVPRGPIGEAWKSAITEADLYGALFSGQITTREFLDTACDRVDEQIQNLNWSSTEGLNLLMESGALTDPDAKVLA